MNYLKKQQILSASKLFLLLFLLLVSIHPAPGFAQPQEIRIGALALRGPDLVLQEWQATADYLSTTIPGYSFKLVPLNFKEIGGAVKAGEVDFVLANPALYVEFNIVHGAYRIATLINQGALGQTTTLFGGVIFTRADRADIAGLADLRNRSFMAVDPLSLGGWLVAWRELRQHGIEPTEDFSALWYGATHDAVVYAVLQGKVDAGSVRTDILERMAAAGKIELEQLKVLNPREFAGFPFLLSTELYPEWPMAALAHTPKELVRLVGLALLELPSEHPAALASNSAGWSVPSRYYPVRALLRELRIGPYAGWGQLDLTELFKRYWRELALLALAMTLLGVTVAYVLYLNRKLAQKNQEVYQLNQNLEGQVVKRTAKINSLLLEKAEDYEEVISSLVNMIEQRDTYTAGHNLRVARYCRLIAGAMGLAADQISQLEQAALLHDIGKIATPDAVLLKPGKLTTLEHELIQLHPAAGHKMLTRSKMYRNLAEIILHHHERHDGRGYPAKLQGEKIPLLSRIIAVADAFDAMTSIRIYKMRKSIGEAIEELSLYSGSQFDPGVVAAAVKQLSELQNEPETRPRSLSELEKKRFSYFYNDNLTGVYNEDYLKIILHNNRDNYEYKSLHAIHLKNLSKYNRREGWEQGDLLLRKFAQELQAYCCNTPNTMIFRIYGNDFVALARERLELSETICNDFASIMGAEIKVELCQLDLACGKVYTVQKKEKLAIITV